MSSFAGFRAVISAALNGEPVDIVLHDVHESTVAEHLDGFNARFADLWHPEKVIERINGYSKIALFTNYERLGASYPASAVRLAEGGWTPSTVVACDFYTVLILSRPADSQTSSTTMFELPDRHISEAEALEDWHLLLSAASGRSRWGFKHRGPLGSDSWQPYRYHPDWTARLGDLHQFADTVPVMGLFKILTGCEFENIGTINPSVPVITINELKAGDLHASIVAPPIPDGHIPSFCDPVELRAHDIVMAQREAGWRGGLPEPIRPLLVSDHDLPLAAGDGLIVLRPRRSLSPTQLQLYVAYLGSRRSRELMGPVITATKAPDGEAGGTTRELTEDLPHLPVPDPDRPLLDAFSAISEAQQVFRTWADEARELMAVAFDATGSVAEARRLLLDRGRIMRQQQAAGELVPSLDYRVREFYPYPIAYRWREIGGRHSANDWRGLYQAVLDTFEVLLSFSAHVGWAAAIQADRRLPPTEQLVRQLEDSKGGASLGHWVNILKYISSAKAFRSVEPDTALGAVARILPETGKVAEAQVRLSSRRNDESHQRRVDDVRLQRESEDALRDLELLLENASVLADLQLVQVLDNKWDNLDRTGRATVQVLQGDHPLARVETKTHAEQGLEEDSLYILDPQGSWLLLRPLLNRRMCPECGTRSIYQPDHRRNGRLQFKALDHGHTVEDAAIEASLGRFLSRSARDPAVSPSQRLD